MAVGDCSLWEEQEKFFKNDKWYKVEEGSGTDRHVVRYYRSLLAIPIILMLSIIVMCQCLVAKYGIITMQGYGPDWYYVLSASCFQRSVMQGWVDVGCMIIVIWLCLVIIVANLLSLVKWAFITLHFHYHI